MHILLFITETNSKKLVFQPLIYHTEHAVKYCLFPTGGFFANLLWSSSYYPITVNTISC